MNLIAGQLRRRDRCHRVSDHETEVDLKSMNLESPPFIIAGLLPARLTVLAAPPKTGKSWLCLDICCAVATGKVFWGCSTIQGDALYLDLEGREWRINERLNAMNQVVPKQLFISPDAASIDAGLLTQLHAWINDRPNPRVIVIDTITRIKRGARRGENSYEADSRMYSPLQKLATENGLAIVAVTHLRKHHGYLVDDPFENIMGSTGLFGVADAAWMIKGRRSDKEMTFIATGRDFDPINNTIQFNHELCRREMIGDCEAITEEKEKASYDTSPLIITINRLMDKNECLQIIATELYAAIAQHTGKYPADTPAVLGKLLRKFAPQLQKYDKIAYVPACTGGRKGRLHAFTRNTL